MRVGFAGTPEFARVALAALLASRHTVALVLSQPDRPAGRGLKLQASVVKQLAVAHGVPVGQPRSLRLDGKYPEDAAAARSTLLAADLDVLVVAAYGLILPPWVLDVPRFGCLNIHASLLPRWRGAAPIHRALEAGDSLTGITIMQMDAGLDTGDMLLVQAMDIAADDTTATLHDRLAGMGATCLLQTLESLAAGALNPLPQPAEGVTYAHKIEKSEALIAWEQPAVVIERRIRAFDPFPGCAAHLGGLAFKVWRAERVDASGPAGQVLQAGGDRLVVACGQDALALTELQVPGGRRIAAREFLQHHAPAVG